jgi:hypothetical protein
MSRSENLSTEASARALGLNGEIPLSATAMAKSLRVAFYPNGSNTLKLSGFLDSLKQALISFVVEIMSYEQALAAGKDGCVGEGIILFAPGEGETGNLAIDHVSSLSKNTIVGVLDGTSSGIAGEGRFQKRVNALVSALVWHMAHVVIYVDEETWTICNMNGAIDTFSLASLHDRVLYSLIPKLAAPVVPPQRNDFAVEQNAFDPSAPEYGLNVREMLIGADLWGKTGLLATQTRIDDMRYRNLRYKHIAAAYLSWRTGMSYGFLARQLPLKPHPALYLHEAHPLLRRLDWDEKDFLEIDGRLLVAPRLGTSRFLVTIPDVSVLCTRSGCEKTKLDPVTDLVTLTLSKGRIALGTAKGLLEGSDCQPSFDTMTIMSHAVGNAIIASILKRISPSSRFVASLNLRGLALAHWHGFLDPSVLPSGYYSHGEENPPVSCSTPQAAVYALSGKLAVFERCIEEQIEYLGDVHIEPSHGTNIIGRSLSDMAELVAREFVSESLVHPAEIH